MEYNPAQMEGANQHSDSMSLSPGPNTFTMERIQAVLQADTFIFDPSVHKGVPAPLICWEFDYAFENGEHYHYGVEEQASRRENFCSKLYNQVLDPEGHVSRLDQVFSSLVPCNFEPKLPTQTILDRVCQILTRLPGRTTELPDMPPVLPSGYFTLSDGHTIGRAWDSLQAASHISTNILRATLHIVMFPLNGHQSLNKVLDTFAEILETANGRFSTAKSEIAKQRWFVVRTFLWTSWQRILMIFFHGYFEHNVKWGFSDHDGISLNLRRPSPVPTHSYQEISRRFTTSAKSSYMCGWAFELLRNDPVSIGMDFRRFHERYSSIFGNRSGRCMPNSGLSCQGDDPDMCQRFKGMEVRNQSAHDYRCRGDCRGLTWDEESYRSVGGGRAVSLDEENQATGILRYCTASGKTLAISHVWSHGQGGRPEGLPGFNECLHRRYVAIAKTFDCDSYWMDTPCIPEDHQLRAEAISNINAIFEKSKVTLVCDRDLMAIDATDLSIRVRESILVTALVCDWNLRQWTFLEAFQGRSSVYVLCKNNVTVPLRETVEIVHRQGCIDIALFLLTAPHLLPSSTGQQQKSSKRPQKDIYSCRDGFLSLETGGSLLSHRAASRPGDDVVIWSLLIDFKVHNDAESLWRSSIGRVVSTSYLLSSAPRLTVPGFRWAPASPTAKLASDPSAIVRPRLISYDGVGSEPGVVTSDGFKSEWLKYDFVGQGKHLKLPAALLELWIHREERSCRINMRRIRKQYMRGFQSGILLRPATVEKTSGLPAVDRFDASRILLAICATNQKYYYWKKPEDDRVFWEWRGVYEWDMSEPLPKLTYRKDIMLV